MEGSAERGGLSIGPADGDGNRGRGQHVNTRYHSLPSWKRDVGRQLDALIVRTVPTVRKAVKWNSPLYGLDGQGWFLGVHVMKDYVKVAFFRGAALRPMPPVASKVKDNRYFEIREGDMLDDAQMSAWVKQVAVLPGWVA